ncbi:MAG: hypothetical protein RI974_354 [Actinomycetota bacterium]|jgi:hypothetical protein
MKISRSHVGALLLALFGLLNLSLFATGDLKFENFGYVFGGDWQADLTLFYIQMTRFVFIPVLIVLVAVAVFVPQLKFLAKRSDIVVGSAAILTIVTVLGYAAYVVNVFGADFGAFIFGYPGEEITLFSLARIGFALVFVTLALTVLDVLKRFGVEVSFGKGAAANATTGLKGFMKTLLDASLENFISRKVSGVLYIITAWLIIASAALLEVLVLVELLRGTFLAFFGLILVPVVTLLSLIIVRMAFEAGIALIVIAENTKK